MKVLVTGGAGFIGHHLATALVRRGDDVVVLDSLITGTASRVAPIRNSIKWIRGDIRDARTTSNAANGVDTVFHLAALPSVKRSIDDPVLANDINVGGTIQVMEAAAGAGVRRVIFAGSSSVYGNNPDLPRKETQPVDPQSPYAVSKVAAEQYVSVLGAVRGIETVVLRYFNVFGPGQDPDSPYAAVVPKFISAALGDQHPQVNGDGGQSRDFTYVANVVSANLLAATRSEAAGGTFNIGCGERHTLLDLLVAIERATGQPMTPVFGPPLVGDVRDSVADISLATECIGYRPDIGFDRGVQMTVASFIEQRSGRDP